MAVHNRPVRALARIAYNAKRCAKADSQYHHVIGQRVNPVKAKPVRDPIAYQQAVTRIKALIPNAIGLPKVRSIKGYNGARRKPTMPKFNLPD